MANWNILLKVGVIFPRLAKLLHGHRDDLTDDAVIAATAAIHGLTVVTRNVADFRHFGVKTPAPFKSKKRCCAWVWARRFATDLNPGVECPPAWKDAGRFITANAMSRAPAPNGQRASPEISKVGGASGREL
ncbi:MAG: hypothetical protein ACOYJ6_14920 [Caulobacterales bacterium]